MSSLACTPLRFGTCDQAERIHKPASAAVTVRARLAGLRGAARWISEMRTDLLLVVRSPHPTLDERSDLSADLAE